LVAPPAVRGTPAPPLHIEGEGGVTLMVRAELTVTVTVCVPEHPEVVPVTVYVVVDAGLALTVEPTVVLKPVGGDHENVDAPFAVRLTFPPGHIDGLVGNTDTVGAGFTVIEILAVFVHPAASVPVTVYELDDAGVKANPLVTPPVQLYDVAVPPPVNVTVLPLQTVVLGLALAVTVGSGFTVIDILAVLVHPAASVPVTVYELEEAGVKANPLVTPPVQLYDVAVPPPVKVSAVPAQILVPGLALAVTVGAGFTVIDILAVLVHPAASVPVTVYELEEAGVKANPLVTPPVQLYDVAVPPPVKVSAVPAQILVPGLALAVTVGAGFTVIDILAVLVHPAASVPVTVYELEEAGVKANPLVTPPVQLYDVAVPPPVKVSAVPAQILVPGLALAVTFGGGFTVICIVAVLVHPAAFLPVTVYVFDVTGINPTPLVTPPVQLYDVAVPPPVNVTVVPLQTVVPGLALAVTFGAGFTVIFILAVLVHPAASVPVTVYVFDVTGTNPTPSVTPPVQLYDVAVPPPVNVTVVPLQTVVPGLALAVTVGGGFTTMVIVVEPHVQAQFVTFSVTLYVPAEAYE